MYMFSLGITAWASDVSTELEKALEGATKSEAFAGGTVMGMALGIALAILVVFFILQVIADWKIFTKAGRPGWKSIIPILHYYEEYDLCWSGKGMLGVLYAISLIAYYIIDGATSDPTPATMMTILTIISCIGAVLTVIQSFKLSKAFGHGAGVGFVLILFGPIGRLILGFGNSRYVGAQ